MCACQLIVFRNWDLPNFVLSENHPFYAHFFFFLTAIDLISLDKNFPQIFTLCELGTGLYECFFLTSKL